MQVKFPSSSINPNRKVTIRQAIRAVTQASNHVIEGYDMSLRDKPIKAYRIVTGRSARWDGTFDAQGYALALLGKRYPIFHSIVENFKNTIYPLYDINRQKLSPKIMDEWVETQVPVVKQALEKLGEKSLVVPTPRKNIIL